MSAVLPSVLVVDDDEVFRRVVARELREAGFEVGAVARGELVEGALLEGGFDVVVLDLKMPGMDGLDTLARIKAIRPLAEVVMLTAHGSVESAVQALKLGAYDFLTKPCDLDHLESVIRRAAQARTMRSENEALRQELRRQGDEGELLGASEALGRVRSLIAKVAPSGSTVLIRGESGSGKELVARAIHALHPGPRRAFVVVDCGATDENLVLSELFGHERGAYTGATQCRHGFFELADGGTILIDEIGDAPASLQTSLLRVLETGTFRRVGGERQIRVNVRVLAATHRDLEARVRTGAFREDLYHRLNVFTIEIPPLRDRLEDIPVLVRRFLAHLRPGRPPEVSARATAVLQAYHWPGNVRELRHVIERAVILSDGEVIGPEHLPASLRGGRAAWELDTGEPLLSFAEVERRYLVGLLPRFAGNRSRLATALGISERTLYRKLRALRGPGAARGDTRR